MKESEDISARAEERIMDRYNELAELLMQSESLDASVIMIKQFVSEACLAAQSHISEERIEDIIDELDNKLIRWSTEESSEWGAWRIGVRDGLLADQSQSVEGRMYTERDMIAFGVFLGSYQNLEIEEVLDIFNKESGISEKPNNHIESLEKKLMQ